MEILNIDWFLNNEIFFHDIYIYIYIYKYCFGQSGVDLWYRMIGFFKFLVGIADIADVVCLLFFLFIIKPIIKPLILSSQFILWLVISHKNVLPFRIFGSMSEVFLRKFLRNNIYFISKKCAVPKNSEASMKTIHTKTVFNWPNQHVRRSQHPHKHLK